MFSSTVLDLAVGMIFCFLTASLTTGAVVEAISSLISWRAKTLLSGIQQLLNDKDLTGLAGQLYAHASVNPLGPGKTNSAGQGDGTVGASADPQGQGAGAAAASTNPTGSGDDKMKALPSKAILKTNMPSYIDRQLFACAMMDITGISYQVAAAAAAGSQPSLPALHAQVAGTFAKIPNPQIQAFLAGVIDRSFGDAEKIQAELAAWFDHAMDRVSGFYKRWTQWVSFVIALVLAAVLNIDAVSAAKTLWMQPTFAAKLASTSTPTAADAIQQLSAALPIGWPHGFGDFGGKFWVWVVVGWFITALSTLFGAPFWFDMLQSVVRLKGSGPSPKEKADGTAGSA